MKLRIVERINGLLETEFVVEAGKFQGFNQKGKGIWGWTYQCVFDNWADAHKHVMARTWKTVQVTDYKET